MTARKRYRGFTVTAEVEIDPEEHGLVDQEDFDLVESQVWALQAKLDFAQLALNSGDVEGAKQALDGDLEAYERIAEKQRRFKEWDSKGRPCPFWEWAS